MKEKTFSLYDPLYFYIIGKLMEKIYEKTHETAIVGGIAVQAHLFDISSKEGIIIPPEYFRKTDDIDMCFSPSVRDQDLFDVVTSLNSLEGLLEGYCYFNVSVERLGQRKPILKIKMLNNKNEEETTYIKMNFSNRKGDAYLLPEEYYEKQINEAKIISIKHPITQTVINLSVSPLYLVIGTKLINGREKDIADINNIASILSMVKEDVKGGFYLNIKALEKLMQILTENGRSDILEKYEALIAKIKKTSI